MKSYLYFGSFAAILCFGGCRQSDPEPDFSGIQDIPYTVQQVSGASTSNTTYVRIYPNPFFHDVNIMVGSDNKPVAIYLSDEKGKYSKKIEVTTGGYKTIWVDFNHMPKGVYVCEVQQQGKVDRYRLVKAR